MINGKKKGNKYECQLVNEFKELLNIEELYTTRNNNKVLDNKGVDIDLENFYIQAKNTKTCQNYAKLINEIKAKTEGKKPVIIYNKITYKGEYVILEKELFNQILKQL